MFLVSYCLNRHVLLLTALRLWFMFPITVGQEISQQSSFLLTRISGTVLSSLKKKYSTIEVPISCRLKSLKSLFLLIETIEILFSDGWLKLLKPRNPYHCRLKPLKSLLLFFWNHWIDIPVSVGINKSIFVWWHQAHPARPTDSADLRNGLESQRQHSQVLLLCQHESCCEAI